MIVVERRDLFWPHITNIKRKALIKISGSIEYITKTQSLEKQGKNQRKDSPVNLRQNLQLRKPNA